MRQIAVILGMCWFIACGSDDSQTEDSFNPADAGISDKDEEACVDADGDGFGARCERGPDCNDQDDTIFEDCPACMRAARGCVCEPGTEPVDCKMSPEDVSEDNPLCKTGQRFCRDGTWTECIGVVSFSR